MIWYKGFKITNQKIGRSNTKFGLTILAKIKLIVLIEKFFEYATAINKKNPKTPLVERAIVFVNITGDILKAIKDKNLTRSLIS